MSVFGTGYQVGGVDVVTSVTFGGTPATCTTVDDSELACTTPAHVSAQVTVTVTTFGGPSLNNSPSDVFIYNTPPPAVTGLSPVGGPEAGGNTVTITGSGFSGTTAVVFGATAATGNCTVNMDTQITCTNVPAGTGVVDVRVTTPSGQSANTGADNYVYAPVPTVPCRSSGPGTRSAESTW